MIEIFVQQSILYLQQNWRKFLTNADDMKGAIGVNYIMAVNQLPIAIPIHWDFVESVAIQNIFVRTRYWKVLQNNHFADNTKQDKIDKDYKIRIIDQLNESLQAVFRKEPDQSIDKHMTKLKGRSCLL